MFFFVTITSNISSGNGNFTTERKEAGRSVVIDALNCCYIVYFITMGLLSVTGGVFQTKKYFSLELKAVKPDLRR